MLAKGETPILFNSSSTTLRDYVFSANLTALLEVMLVKEKYNVGVFNACSGVGSSAPEIFSIMKSHSERQIDAIYDDPEKFWAKLPAVTEGRPPLGPGRVSKEV
jgi:UDP-glucose 4-epimerase/UDP-N-acetylglucosamine 4-epimerase